MNFKPLLNKDKIYHLVAGFSIAVLVGAAAKNPGIGVLVAMGASALKEGYDEWDNRKRAKAGLPPRHSVEFFDVVSTALGAMVGGGLVGLAL